MYRSNCCHRHLKYIFRCSKVSILIRKYIYQQSVVDCDADHTKSHLCRCLKVHNHCLDGAVGALRCCLGRRFGAPPQGVIGHLQAYSTICNRCVGWICTSIWPGLLGSKYYFKQPSTSVPNEGESMPDELVSNDGSLLAMDQSIVFVVHW